MFALHFAYFIVQFEILAMENGITFLWEIKVRHERIVHKKKKKRTNERIMLSNLLMNS